MKKLYFSIFLIFVSAISYSQWVTLTSGTTNHLKSVFFTDINTGYAVGENGIIIKTIDGGINWFPQTSNTTFYLNSVFFPSQDTGYIVGCDLMFNINIILKTIDGGTNWQTQTSGVVGYLSSVYFTSNDTGFAVGGNNDIEEIVLKTTDGGTNWIDLSAWISSNPLMSVNFINANIGFAVGWDDAIIYTDNGGVNWCNVFPSNGTHKQLNSVFVINPTSFSFCTVGQTGTILTFTDFVDTYQTSPTSNWLTSVFFTSPDTGYIGGDGGFILKTTNGGMTWSPQNTNISEGISSIFFISPDTGFAVGDYGTIQKTTNGGTVGIENKENKEGIVIFIDPAQQYIEISGDNIENGTYYEIINSEGKTLSSNKIVQNNQRINIKNLSSGIYLSK